MSADRVNALTDQLGSAVQKADWADVDRLQEELKRLGPGAIPFLLQRMKQEGIDRHLQGYLLDTLRRIPGEKTTETLMEITLNDPNPEIAGMAGMAIGNAIIRVRLSEEQLNALIRRIETEKGTGAAQWAYALARAEHVDSRKLAAPTVERFIKAVEEVRHMTEPSSVETLFSHRVWYLNLFLRAFRYIDPSASIPLLKEKMTIAEDETLRKWLLIARGMSGDQSVGEALREIVDSRQEDISVRAVALNAYAKAMKQQAVSFLENYVADTTPGPNPRYPPLRIIAKDALADIRNAK